LIVVDASVLAPALADDNSGGDRARERLAGERLVAPELIDLEVLSAVRGALRANQLNARRAEQALSDLAALPLRRAPHLPLLPRVWELRDEASVYDGSYIALAEALGVDLLTADTGMLRTRGARCTIELLESQP
jgi:predicted nucleic acid-binding protein